MNSRKKQKDRTLKDELPRSVGALYATGDQQRNNPRKNEDTELKQKQHPVVDVTGDGCKVWCCKEQCCGEMPYRYQLGLTGLLYNLKFVVPC